MYSSFWRWCIGTILFQDFRSKIPKIYIFLSNIKYIYKTAYNTLYTVLLEDQAKTASSPNHRGHQMARRLNSAPSTEDEKCVNTRIRCSNKLTMVLFWRSILAHFSVCRTNKSPRQKDCWLVGPAVSSWRWRGLWTTAKGIGCMDFRGSLVSWLVGGLC